MNDKIYIYIIFYFMLDVRMALFNVIFFRHLIILIVK